MRRTNCRRDCLISGNGGHWLHERAESRRKDSQGIQSVMALNWNKGRLAKMLVLRAKKPIRHSSFAYRAIASVQPPPWQAKLHPTRPDSTYFDLIRPKKINYFTQPRPPGDGKKYAAMEITCKFGGAIYGCPTTHARLIVTTFPRVPSKPVTPNLEHYE